MSNQVVKIRRETIAACPICNKLFREATTISECLHTFCRKCIDKKISDDELECCPVCDVNLGSVPLEKLRPDHNLQDVRARIFPFKKRKVEAPEVAPSVTLPVRRKERSLSSLVVNTPRVTSQNAMTGRRSKAVARKTSALRGSRFPIEKPVKKEEDSAEDRAESSSSLETQNKLTQNVRQNSSNAETSSRLEPEKGAENGAETWEGKVDWKPLNFLVEVANRSKSLKYNNSHGSASKSEPQHTTNSEGHIRKTKVKEHGTKSKEKRIASILSVHWYKAVEHAKDGNVPVSFIQKYLKRKLDLTCEDEVEIKCFGQPVVPTLHLNNLVDLWLQTTASTSERVPASIGSSAKNFVMVLAYARKATPS